MEILIAYTIICFRICCLVLFGLLLIKSSYNLVVKTDDSLEVKKVNFFVVMLTSAISYASFVSVMNWSGSISSAEDINRQEQLQSLLSAILFLSSGLYGVWTLKAWRFK